MPLKVSDGIGAWIKDFKKSDAPQFKGKSEKERRDQAIAAYLSAKRGGKPQEENVSSADRKPQMYTKPDGKRGVRMVKVDREVIKTDETTKKEDSDAVKAFLAKGGKITKLPPGKAQGYHGKDDPGKDQVGMLDRGDTKQFGTRKKVKSMGEGKQTHVFDNEKDARAKAKEIGGKYVKGTGKSAGKHAAIKEAAPKPLNRSDHTHTVHIDGEGKYRVKAKSMDHAKKVAFKQAGISKLHGHPTMEPKTRIYGEAKRVVHSDRPDSLKSLRVMHPKPASDKMPFDGPYRKAGEVRKDKYGNVIKNLPRHLARNAARRAAGMDESVNEETNFQVNIEGLPMMFMSGMGQGEIMQKLRKIVKQPSMIQSVKRVTDADVKKTFRLKAQGRDEEEQVDEALKHTHAVIDGNGKVAGMSSDEKGAKDIARRHNGRVVKLKKPISSRKGDMMINRPFSEAKLDELSPATMARYHSAADKSKSRAWAKFDLGKTTAADALKNQEKRTAGQKLARKKINQKAFRTSK